jgi:hypothetical protein
LTAPEPADIKRPRDLRALLVDSIALYRRHFWMFLAIALAVVVPVYAIVLGVGLGEFTGDYQTGQAPGPAVVGLLVRLLVVIPLVSVMVLDALLEIAAGRTPRIAKSIQAGLDAFARVFWPMLIALLVAVGTFYTVVIPFLLAVRCYFVPQVVVMEDARGPDALRASWELTRGFAWRVAGIALVGTLVFVLAGGLVATPVAVLARSLDSEAIQLAAFTLADVLAAPPLGIFAALLYFDLRARQSAPAR